MVRLKCSGEGATETIVSCGDLVEDGLFLHPSSTLLWGSVEEEYERFVGRSWKVNRE